MYLADFIYVFLTDLVSLPSGDDYPSYLEREPNYDKCLLNAYISAFNEKKDGKITHDLLKKIHQQAMAFSSIHTPGQYKINDNYFPANPQRMTDGQEYQSIPRYSLDIIGIREFLLHWFSNNKDPVHMISFTARDQELLEKKTMYVILKSNTKENDFSWGMMKDGQWTHLTLNLEDTITKMIPLIEDYHYNFRITSMFGILKKDEVSTKTHQKMTLIINDFQKAITRAHSSDEKITAIVTHVQRIAQLHPFRDGNIRTCYVLINKLLRDYDLPLTILLNPNRFDCCSVATNVAMVKLGQTFYQQLLQHEKGDLILKTQETMDELKTIIIPPQKLSDIDCNTLVSFINQVLKNKPQKNSSQKATNDQFFSNKKTAPPLQLIAQLKSLVSDEPRYTAMLNAFNEGKYNLALRKACCGGSFEIIMFFLDACDALKIDHREPSSNGNTAIDWFMQNKQMTDDDKLTIRNKFTALDRCQSINLNIA